MHSRFFLNLFAGVLIALCLLALLVINGVGAVENGSRVDDARPVARTLPPPASITAYPELMPFVVVGP